MRTFTCSFGFTAGLLAFAGVASAQLVTPPPGRPPAIDDRIPSTAPPPPPPPFEVRTNPQPAQPVRARPAPRRPPLRDLPDLPYTSLVNRDAAGNLILIHEPLERAALRKNPTLPPDFESSLADYFAERAATFERAAIDNLDILEQVERGFIEQTDYNERTGIQTVVRTLRPLNPPNVPKRITDDLEERGLLDPTQAAFNIKVIRDYQQAQYPQPKPDADDAARRENAWVIAKIASRYGIEESELAYQALMMEAASKLASLAGTPGLSAEQQNAMRTSAKSYNPSLSRDQKIKVWHDATAGLTVDQRREILRAMVAAR